MSDIRRCGNCRYWSKDDPAEEMPSSQSDNWGYCTVSRFDTIKVGMSDAHFSCDDFAAKVKAEQKVPEVVE